MRRKKKQILIILSLLLISTVELFFSGILWHEKDKKVYNIKEMLAKKTRDKKCAAAHF